MTFASLDQSVDARILSELLFDFAACHLQIERCDMPACQMVRQITRRNLQLIAVLLHIFSRHNELTVFICMFVSTFVRKKFGVQSSNKTFRLIRFILSKL